MAKDYLKSSRDWAAIWIEAEPQRRNLPYDDFLSLVTMLEKVADNAYSDGFNEPQQVGQQTGD